MPYKNDSQLLKISSSRRYKWFHSGPSPERVTLYIGVHKEGKVWLASFSRFCSVSESQTAIYLCSWVTSRATSTSVLMQKATAPANLSINKTNSQQTIRMASRPNNYQLLSAVSCAELCMVHQDGVRTLPYQLDLLSSLS